MTQNIREEDWKEELYQVFHNMPSTVDARTEKFHEIVKKIDSHLNTTLKEIEEEIGESSEIPKWLLSGDAMLLEGRNEERQRIKQLIHQKLIK